MLSATMDTAVATGMPSPRIVGAPPIRLGSTVIRSNITPRSYGGQVGNPSIKPRSEYVPKFGPAEAGG